MGGKNLPGTPAEHLGAPLMDHSGDPRREPPEIRHEHPPQENPQNGPSGVPPRGFPKRIPRGIPQPAQGGPPKEYPGDLPGGSPGESFKGLPWGLAVASALAAAVKVFIYCSGLRTITDRSGLKTVHNNCGPLKMADCSSTYGHLADLD